MSQNIVAAIEIGSQQISAIIGRKEPDGAINVMAAEQEPSYKFVQRGRVFNTDLMCQSLKGMIDRMEKRAHKAVNQIYIGAGGMGLRSLPNQIVRNYGEPTKITQEIVDSILDENRSFDISGYSILDVLPLEYRLGTQSLPDPVGVMTNKVVGNFLNVIAPTASLDQLRTSFRSAELPVADIVPTPLALSHVILGDSEKLSGCALVDMGASTTTVAIFDSKLLRHLAVIPLGGDNVTRDLMTVLAIEHQEAEDIKRRYGRAYIEASEESPVTHDNIHLQDGRNIPYDDVASTITARMSEILQNVAHLIRDIWEYTPDRLIGGLIVTGGASNMSAVDKGLLEFTHIKKLRFVKNVPLTVRHSNKSQQFNIDGTFNGAIALVAEATENCCGDERRTPDIFDQPTAEELEAERLRKEEEAEAERQRQAEEAERQRQAEEEAERQRRREARRKGFSSAFNRLRNGINSFFTESDEED